MESSSDKPKIHLDLNLSKQRANRELDLRCWAATALISLPEFCQEARELLELYEDPGALLLLYESYQDWGNDEIREHYDEIAEREPISLDRARAIADFADALASLRCRWGMAAWKDTAEIVMSALDCLMRDCSTPTGFATVAFYPLYIVKFEVEVWYSDHSLGELEKAVCIEVRKEIRKQHRSQASPRKQLGSPRDRGITLRNLEWYFLHKRGLSYRQTMLRWNELHRDMRPLDTTSKSHLGKVKQGINSISRRFGG